MKCDGKNVCARGASPNPERARIIADVNSAARGREVVITSDKDLVDIDTLQTLINARESAVLQVTRRAVSGGIAAYQKHTYQQRIGRKKHKLISI